MKTIKLKTKIEDKELLESQVKDVLSKQKEVCDWSLDYSNLDEILTIHVKELLNEDFIFSGLEQAGIKTEILEIEQVSSNHGKIPSSCE